MDDNLTVPEGLEEIESVDELIENVASISKEEYERIRNQALEDARTRRHNWVMKGRGRLTCTSCPFPHTSFIDPRLKLIGIDEQGNPIFDKY